MKKLVTLLLCIAIASSFVISASAVNFWYINSNSIHIRATEGGTSLGLVNNGDLFTDYGVSSTVVGGNSWRDCKMTSGQNKGVRGYVAKQYTTFGS